MNKELKSLFNNGDNDGNTIIVSDDGKEIKCHSFILKKQCDFAKGLCHFVTKKENKRRINLQYPEKIIKLVLHKMYYSFYDFPHIEINEILQIIALMDEILITNKKDIVEELVNSFQEQITEENWEILLSKIYNNLAYIELEKCLMNYFYDTILEHTDIDQNCPLKNIDMNTDLGRQLLGFCMKKIIKRRTIKYDKLVPIESCEQNEHTIYLINETKCNFINLQGEYTFVSINTFLSFLYNNGVWNTSDVVTQRNQSIRTISPAFVREYHNIGFVKQLYEKTYEVPTNQT